MSYLPLCNINNSIPRDLVLTGYALVQGAQAGFEMPEGI